MKLSVLILAALLSFSSLCLYQPEYKAPMTEDAPSGYVEVVVSDLQVELTRGIIILGNAESNTSLDIYVSREQGENLYAALHNISTPRPLSHDLFMELLEKSGMNLRYITVDRLEDGVYYATMVITQDKAEVSIDARPSDSIVFALKAGAPIYVYEKLMEDHGGQRPIPDTDLEVYEV